MHNAQIRVLLKRQSMKLVNLMFSCVDLLAITIVETSWRTETKGKLEERRGEELFLFMQISFCSRGGEGVEGRVENGKDAFARFGSLKIHTTTV